MIDPDNITNYNRTQGELEEFILFAIMVAGKKAKQIAPKLDKVLEKSKEPFSFLRHLYYGNKLEPQLLKNKTGKYTLLEQAIPQLIFSGLDLRTCTTQDLEKIKGIGPKSSRFFILHSRPDQKIACLDTHILSWIRENLDPAAPKSTPTKKEYYRLEKLFVDYCEQNRLCIADFDLALWVKYSSGKK